MERQTTSTRQSVRNTPPKNSVRRASLRTMVTRDGLVARRRDETVGPKEAAKMVRALNALPTVLEAWAETVPRSERKILCWLPSTPRAMAAMQRAFWTDEYARARAEGPQFVWTKPDNATGPRGVETRVCANPKSGKSYTVTRGRDPQTGYRNFQCQCPRFSSAGVCKHTLDARLNRRFEEMGTGK